MTIRVLNLDRLKSGFPGISAIASAAHLEACLICLDYHQHKNGVLLKTTGISDDSFQLEWQDEITDQMRRTWADMSETTEKAACGIAFLLMLELTSYTIVERSRKGTGFDYWLDEKESSFLQKSARLEVSGILKAENTGEIRARVRRKEKQISLSDDTRLPAYIVVVEFSQLIADVIEKDGHDT